MRIAVWKIRLWLAHVFVWTGFSFLLIAISFAALEFLFLHSSQLTTGVVVRNIEQYKQEWGTEFCPEFTYKDAGGQTHTLISHACAAPPAFTVGQSIGIRYSKNRPRRAQPDTLGAKSGLVIGFGSPPLLFLPLRFLLFRKLRSQGHPLDPAFIVG